MSKDSVNVNDFIGRLGTYNPVEVKEIFNNLLRGCVREMVARVMSEEVVSLCGPSHVQSDSKEYRRAGSAVGYFCDENTRESIHRPRVRKKNKNSGKETEVHLESYAAAQDSEAIHESLMVALKSGVSGSDQRAMFPKAKGTSSSSVSRLWIKEGAKIISELRKRDLENYNWLALMVDGIVLSKDLTAVVALGITDEGKKLILDFEIGNTESFEVTKALMENIKDRGFKPVSRRLLSVTDGGKGILKAIRHCFDNPVMQRCLVHKERNVKARLSRRHHGTMGILFNDLRHSQGIEDAELAKAQIRKFLEKYSKEGLKTFNETGDELLAFFYLNVPSTLNISLLSTNCIENSFKNVRRKIGRVNRWRPETDQPHRWMAFALKMAEDGFNRIKGFQDLNALKKALDKVESVEGPIINKKEVDKEVSLV